MLCAAVLGLLVPMFASAQTPARADNQQEGKDWHYVPSTPRCPAPKTDDDKPAPTQGSADDAPVSPGGGADAWLTEGTKEYKIAQEVWDYFVKEKGTSGSFASGVLANVAEESAHYKGIDVIEGGSLAGENTKSGSSSGGGLFQFTPATKFENSEFWAKNDKNKGWAVANQVDFVWSSELGNGAILPYLKANQYGQSGLPSSMDELFATDDARVAARAFQVGYERPAQYHPGREDDAAKADQVFNKDHVKADKKKLGDDGGDDSGPSDSADLDSDEAKKSQSKASADPDCATSGGEEEEASGGALGPDASGEHHYDVSGSWGKSWKWDALPDDMKQYAIDPESLGLKHGDCSNWTKWTNTSDAFLNGQCVALTKAFFGEFWEKGGQHPQGFLCNGNECADKAAEANGGKPSDKPKAGAAVSVETGTPIGHTYVVSHVFKNGDILAIEQNTPDSGQTVGEECSWNYRLVSQEGYKSEQAKFYTPDGYKPDSRAKTK